MSKDDIVLAALQRGESLTPLDGFRLCGTLALHSLVARLRKREIAIDCEMVHENGRNYGRYSMRQAIPYG